MLGLLAMKKTWQKKRRDAGKDTSRPNIIMNSAVQVCWEKFCNYFEVEPKWVPISPDHLVLDGHELEKYVDENTIAVVVIMLAGSIWVMFHLNSNMMPMDGMGM